MVPAQETFRRRALKLKVDFDLRDALPDEGQKSGAAEARHDKASCSASAPGAYRAACNRG